MMIPSKAIFTVSPQKIATILPLDILAVLCDTDGVIAVPGDNTMRGDEHVRIFFLGDGRRCPSLKVMVMAMATYPGGKNGAGVYQTIINQMPPHRIYVEAFLGGGAVMRYKKPAACSIGIDADSDVISAARLWSAPPNLTVLQGDALLWLASDDGLYQKSSDTLIYLDPPYLLHTRRQHRPIYRYELSDDDHARLLGIITRLPCMVMISGYRSDLYEFALAGWRAMSFQARTRGGAMATEYLWMNFPEPLELHDYRYLGCDFRERERIKRKKTRWMARLSHMDVLERHALMSAVAELRSSLAISV